MYMADFDYNITYICGEENTAMDALSHMPNTIPDACLATCAIAYTRNAPKMPAGGILNITTDQSLLDAIITGYWSSVIGSSCDHVVSSHLHVVVTVTQS